MKLKLMLRPFGLSVPSSKISLISCFFRRVLSPLQRLRPQIMMSLSEWEAELKCSATGKPGELFRMLRRCSPKRSRSRLPVSPMYKQAFNIARLITMNYFWEDFDHSSCNNFRSNFCIYINQGYWSPVFQIISVLSFLFN